jgi:ribose/xylose/arabinose/galactoside ABC-type transport system permease subunit
MLNMARGVAMIINGGMVVPLIPRLIKDPALDAFIFIGRGRIMDVVPTMSIAFLLVLILGFIIYQKNILGYRMRAVGGNPEAARVSGISVTMVKIAAFAIMGFLAAFGGIINSGFLGNVQSTAGQGLELDVIAATILGGASLNGGEGTIVGTLIGVLLLGVLRNGLVLMGVSPFVQMVLIGAVLIGAVALDMRSRKK